MRTLLLPFCLCLPLLVFAGHHPAAAEETQQPTSRAFFNPRVSTRSIALNQQVSITFTTLRPQVEGVDPDSSVRAALAQPGVSERWRVMGEPRVEIDPKIGTLRVHLILMPRISGSVELPDIPVRWLNGNQVARFGSVEVANHLAHGARTLPVTKDAQGVHGHPWGSSYEDLLAATNTESGTIDDQGDLGIEARSGLRLIIRGGRLAAARILAPGLAFDQARVAFHDRWGDSLPSGRSDSNLWIIGWVRIEATPRPGENNGTVITLTHEGIEAQIARGAVQDQVFNLLDGGSSANETAPTEHDHTDGSPTRGDSTSLQPAAEGEQNSETGTAERPRFDPAAEFERQLQRSAGEPRPDTGP